MHLATEPFKLMGKSATYWASTHLQQFLMIYKITSALGQVTNFSIHPTFKNLATPFIDHDCWILYQMAVLPCGLQAVTDTLADSG